MKVTVELDFYDVQENGFETAIENAIIYKLTSDFEKRAEAFISDKINIMLQSAVEVTIENKMRNLLNEDVVITDKWGKKIFVGSPEDYIKKQMDEKLLSPVDNSGKKLSGCTSSGQTWLEWNIEKAIESTIKTLTSETRSSALKEYTKLCNDILEEIKMSSTHDALSKVMKDIVNQK